MNRSDPTPRSFSTDQLRAALGDVGGPARPDYLADIVAQAGRVRQRPAWTFLERWLSMDIGMRRQGVGRAAVVFATLVLLVGLLAAGVAYVGSQRNELDRPLGLPGSATFNSSIHGISIDYPSGWQVRPATQLWTDRFVPDFNSPTGDVIFDPALGDSLYLVLTSMRPNGRSVDEWHGLKAWPVFCSGTQGGEVGPSHVSYTLDGAQGYVWSSVCGSGGASLHGAEVATASRGYIIYLYVGSESHQATYDKAWFAAALETVDLRPEEAFDAP